MEKKRIIEKSNIKHWPEGVITYTVETELWWPRTDSNRLLDRGWGNGYICIPEDHPYINRCKEQLKKDIIARIDEMKGLGSLYLRSTLYDMVIPHPSQEWTYGEHKKAEDMDPVLEPIPDKGYYILGCDCNHSWNTEANSPEEKVVEWIEEYVPVVNEPSIQ